MPPSILAKPAQAGLELQVGVVDRDDHLVDGGQRLGWPVLGSGLVAISPPAMFESSGGISSRFRLAISATWLLKVVSDRP